MLGLRCLKFETLFHILGAPLECFYLYAKNQDDLLIPATNTTHQRILQTLIDFLYLVRLL